MARKRRLQSDSEDGQEDIEMQDDRESSRPKKKRVSSVEDHDETEDMDENEELDCSQVPDFVVSTAVSHLSDCAPPPWLTFVQFRTRALSECRSGLQFIKRLKFSGKVISSYRLTIVIHLRSVLVLQFKQAHVKLNFSLWKKKNKKNPHDPRQMGNFGHVSFVSAVIGCALCR